MHKLGSASEICSLAFGPYDNGHLILGLKNGQLFAFDVLNCFELVFCLNLAPPNCPISSIIFDPTNLILAVSEAANSIYAVSLIEKKREYVYLDLGVR